MNKVICVVDNKALKDTGLKTEHGLAFWIETEAGTVLFDTGQTADALAHNMSLLNLSVKNIDAVAISHSHFDHTGGLEAVIPENPDLIMYANEDVFRSKFSLHDGKYDASGFEKSREEYTNRVEVRLSDTPTEIFRDGGEWKPDPYRDDMSLVLKTQDGLVVVCGCCHAGLLNTLAHVKENFKGPIITVMGGTHLMTADGRLMDHVINVLDERYSDLLFYLNHCTGDDAIKALGNAFGERVQPFPAGAVVTFNDQKS